MDDFLKQHIGELITAIVGAFGGWLFQRRKQKAETQSSEIDNAIQALKYYREISDDLGNRLREAIAELNKTKEMVRELEEKVEALTEELKKYKQLNGKVA
jgi:DNA repair exonuclease SbcCD ATPase subunit